MDHRKNIALLSIGLMLVFVLCACSVSENDPPAMEASGAQQAAVSASAGERGEQTSSDVLKDDQSEGIAVSLTIKGLSFTALLEDNETAQAFSECLPLTLDMSELNGNEKFSYMETSFPTNPENPNQINAGDLMLYGDNCLVLFFDNFSTSYSYTRLGSVTDADSLTNVLGSGTVTITFTRME